MNALNVFNSCKTHCNRQNFCRLKNAYKKLCSKKKREFENIQIKKLTDLKKERPKEFWKFFKKKRRKCNSISTEDFFTYFKSLGADIFQSSNQQADDFCSNHDFNCEDSAFDELNSRITVQEILLSIKSLKRCKAMGNDHLMNEYLIESSDILASHICDIFNAVFDSGFFPDKWSEGLIVPVHKKGMLNDPNNYRGITLLSCLSKLFTSVLNNRINKFCDENSVISDAQFGFKKGVSTTDASFILMSIVQKFLNENKRLYCIFVDLKKCFDSINRNALWLKLYKHGIQGKLLRIIRDMYSTVKSCVKNGNLLSDFFDYTIGLRQGETISPILVSLFLEDLELFLLENPNSGININELSIIILLFADDMVIFGKNPSELQSNIDKLSEYCDKWGLEVNVDKTKTMVFRKRGPLKLDELWTYKGKVIKSVDNFSYLGTLFHYTGSFAQNREYLSSKALKALNVLLVNCSKFRLSAKILCQLFDAFVGSILG